MRHENCRNRIFSTISNNGKLWVRWMGLYGLIAWRGRRLDFGRDRWMAVSQDRWSVNLNKRRKRTKSATLLAIRPIKRASSKHIILPGLKRTQSKSGRLVHNRMYVSYRHQFMLDGLGVRITYIDTSQYNNFVFILNYHWKCRMFS